MRLVAEHPSQFFIGLYSSLTLCHCVSINTECNKPFRGHHSKMPFLTQTSHFIICVQSSLGWLGGGMPGGVGFDPAASCMPTTEPKDLLQPHYYQKLINY